MHLNSINKYLSTSLIQIAIRLGKIDKTFGLRYFTLAVELLSVSEHAKQVDKLTFRADLQLKKCFKHRHTP